MATCTQVDPLLQAYIDGELSQSERVIVEQHIAECRACERVLLDQQRTAAMMFESLVHDRLHRDLRQPILEHLPEIDRMPIDVTTVNWRVKHPVGIWARVGRGVPVAVGVVLLIVAVVLRYEWPTNVTGENAIGMVMHVEGKGLRHPSDSSSFGRVTVADFVAQGDKYETGEGAEMMLTLAGPTQIKLGANTLIKVNDDRWINVLKGRVWLDVSKDERFFRVVPPLGEITVIGTQFDVDVHPDRTRVTVSEGQVHVESDRASGLVEEGQQVDMIPGATSLVPWAVDAKGMSRWADAIGPAAEALVAYDEHIAPRTQAKVLRAPQVFMLPRSGGSTSVKSIEVQWNPDEHRSGHCDYLVYVTNSRDRLLFKDAIPGSTFGNKSLSSYKLQVPEGVIEDFRVLYIRVIPDLTTGKIETSFKNTIFAEAR